MFVCVCVCLCITETIHPRHNRVRSNTLIKPAFDTHPKAQQQNFPVPGYCGTQHCTQQQYLTTTGLQRRRTNTVKTFRKWPPFNSVVISWLAKNTHTTHTHTHTHTNTSHLKNDHHLLYATIWIEFDLGVKVKCFLLVTAE